MNNSISRRKFLTLGSIGIGCTALSFYRDIQAAEKHNNNSVIWIWLGGGASHFETFNVNPDSVPDKYRSVNGIQYHSPTGIKMGGLWEKLVAQADRLNVVANFSHMDASHLHGIQWVNTAHYNPDRAENPVAKYPSYGAIVSAVYGTNNPKNGMPTYIGQDNISGDGAAWLGGAYKPFDVNARNNLKPSVELERLNRRSQLLDSMDKANIENEGAKSLNKYKGQAYDIITGDAHHAFDIEKVWQEKIPLYGNHQIGKKLALAKQLTDYGSKYINVVYDGWDMHNDIARHLDEMVPPIDWALAGLVQDLYQSNTNENVLVIVTTEFGRTTLNATQGRDHWPNIIPLLMFGGKYPCGRIIGQTDKYNYEPNGNKFGPIDLQATIFNHLNIDRGIQRVDNSGRPRYLLEGEGKNIL